MSLKAILTIAALSVSLSAVHAYADGDGGEGNGDPFPFRAVVEATRVEPAPFAARADTMPTPAPARIIAFSEPSRPVTARHTPVAAHRRHAAVSRPVTQRYDDTDISASDIRRLGR